MDNLIYYSQFIHLSHLEQKVLKCTKVLKYQYPSKVPQKQNWIDYVPPKIE